MNHMCVRTHIIFVCEHIKVFLGCDHKFAEKGKKWVFDAPFFVDEAQHCQGAVHVLEQQLEGQCGVSAHTNSLSTVKLSMEDMQAYV